MTPRAPAIARARPRAEGVTGVAWDVDNRRLVFTARGALFSQSDSGVLARAVLLPPRGTGLSAPDAAHGALSALASPAGVPTSPRFVVVQAAGGTLVLDGQTYGWAERRPVLAALDVAAGVLRRLDVLTLSQRVVCALPCAQDPQAAGLVTVDDEGRRALVMQARAPHGDASLLQVDLDSGATEQVARLDGPGWLCGAFAADGRVVSCAQHLGDAPRLVVEVDGRQRLTLAGLQPAAAPCVLGDGSVALLGALSVDRHSQRGEPALLVVPVDGAPQALAPAAGRRVRCRPDGALLVDGGVQCLLVRR